MILGHGGIVIVFYSASPFHFITSLLQRHIPQKGLRILITRKSSIIWMQMQMGRQERASVLLSVKPSPQNGSSRNRVSQNPLILWFLSSLSPLNRYIKLGQYPYFIIFHDKSLFLEPKGASWHVTPHGQHLAMSSWLPAGTCTAAASLLCLGSTPPVGGTDPSWIYRSHSLSLS